MADIAPHHRGNLREALIVAAMALLTEGGIAGLTLRRAAARAGVSHAAPAHHFNGLPGLLTAIAARAFCQFGDAMELARATADPAPFAQLAGICTGYLDFATRHAGIFHLMFVSAEVDRDDPRRIRLFAGCGIVAGSQPLRELAESNAKLVPMRDALQG